MLDAKIHLDAPLHLGDSLGPQRLGRRDPSWRLDGQTVARAFRTPDGPATLAVEVVGEVLRARAWGEGAAWALTRLPALHGLDDRAEGFRPTHRTLRMALQRHPGLRLAQAPDLFAALVGIILGQLVTGREAVLAWSRLVRDVGEPAPGPLDLLLPPSAERMARLPREALIELGALGKQADAIRRVARVARRLDELRTLDDEAVYLRLNSIRGVGPWTATAFLLHGLGRADVPIMGDYHAPDTVGWALHRERAGRGPAADAQMLAWLEPFIPHRGRVMRLLEVAGLGAPRRGPRRPIRRR